MLNRTTSPGNEKSGRGHLWPVKKQTGKRKELFSYQEEPLKRLKFPSFLHQKVVGACSPSAAEDGGEQNIRMPSGLLEQQNKSSDGEEKRKKKQQTRETSTSSISLPLGTKALAKSLMAWIMLTSFKGKDGAETLWVRLLSSVHSNKEELTWAFLSLITAAHLWLGGKSRSTAYQPTAPLNLGEEGAAERQRHLHGDSIDGPLKSGDGSLLRPARLDGWSIIGSNRYCCRNERRVT